MNSIAVFLLWFAFVVNLIISVISFLQKIDHLQLSNVFFVGTNIALEKVAICR